MDKSGLVLGQPGIVWAFLLGNWVIGAGVMLVPGMLDVLALDLGVSIPTASALIGLAAVVMCLGAPLFASYTSRWDRRTLLSGSLALYGVSHMLCALAPNYEVLLPLRMASVVAAAIFTPQASVALGMVLAPDRRAAGITFVFLGWSFASVVAMPMAAWLGAHVGWRPTFFGFGLLSLGGAWVVARATPRGLKGVALPWAAWVAVGKHPALIALLLVTAAAGTGQFTNWAFIAPYTKAMVAPSPEVFGIMLSCFGLAGMLGNVLASKNASRVGQRLGGPHRTVDMSYTAMSCGLAIVGLSGGSFVPFCIGMMLWGVGVFAGNSSQQARLQAASPELAGASLALNTSMIYLGQALGTAIGATVITTSGYAALPIVGVVLLASAVLLSLRAQSRVRGL